MNRRRPHAHVRALIHKRSIRQVGARSGPQGRPGENNLGFLSFVRLARWVVRSAIPCPAVFQRPVASLAETLRVWAMCWFTGGGV